MNFPKSHAEHERNVRALPCIVTGGPSSLHHCHGGSVTERLAGMGLRPAKGMGQRGSGPALLIPLHPELHYVGANPIDGHVGVRTWEARFGRQADHLDSVGRLLGYDLWALHRLWLPPSKILPRRL